MPVAKYYNNLCQKYTYLLSLIIVVIHILLVFKLCTSYCLKEPTRIFHLIRKCQRSNQSPVALENVISLDECFKVATRSKALALNFNPLSGRKTNFFGKKPESIHKNSTNFPRRANRRLFLDQPEQFFNCHALKCPESSQFSTMINDKRFDYYSLYGNPPGPNSFTCLSEIGIFQLNRKPEKYSIAFEKCKNNKNGALAHVASEKRTIAFSKLLQGYDHKNGTLNLAHVGLNYTEHSRSFKNSEKEDLNCFLYRAWAPGHPKKNERFSNMSCVALTTDMNWMTIECDRKLPYICEFYTSPLNNALNGYDDACKSLSEI